MMYIHIVIILLYYCVFLIYYRILFPPNNKNYFAIVLTLTAIAIAYIYRDIYKANWINLIIVLVIMIFGIRIASGMDWLQAVYGGCTCVINAYCFRGIYFIVSFFLQNQKDIYYLLDSKVYYLITIFAITSALLFMEALRRTIFPDIRLKRFLMNKGQLKIIVVYELMSIIYLVIILHGRLLSPDIVWYMSVSFGAFLLTLGMMVYAIYHSIRATQLLEYKWNIKMMEEQYTTQLRHYKSYEKYTENFRNFKHDYKYMMVTLKSLIQQGKKTEALQLLDGIYTTLQEKIIVHKKYSDHVVLDAILQDLANICEENSIRFSVKVSVPRNTKLDLLDSIRIFLNLTNNAVEACCKITDAERFIEIISTTEQGWLTLAVINSFDGIFRLKNGLPVTTKIEKEEHGLGILIVNEIVIKMGGFVFIDPNMENKIFTIRIHIPQLKEETL